MRSKSATPANAFAFAGVALLLGLGTVGCTSAPDPERTPAPAASVPVNGLPDGVTLPEDVPTDVPNDPDARLDVALEQCEATEDGWRAAGTVVNGGESPTTYEITVFFTTDSGTVLQYGSVDVAVAASETAAWSVDAEFVAPAGTLCVLRGVAAE